MSKDRETLDLFGSADYGNRLPLCVSVIGSQVATDQISRRRYLRAAPIAFLNNWKRFPTTMWDTAQTSYSSAAYRLEPDVWRQLLPFIPIVGMH
jgi:hypothetical protein